MASLTGSALAPKALSSRVATSASFRAPAATPGPASRGALQVVAASKKKDVRLTITLECTEQKESGVAGMSRYMTQKVRARVVHRVASRVARISRRRVAFRTRGKPYALEGFGSLSVVRGGKGGTSRAEARRRFLPPRARRRRPRPPPSFSRPLRPSTPSTVR